jgi:hypothetical protein
VDRSSRRFYRSLVLSLAALGVLVWVTLDQFDVPQRDILALVLGTLLLAAVTIVFAALVTGLWVAARRWRRRHDTD